MLSFLRKKSQCVYQNLWIRLAWLAVSLTAKRGLEVTCKTKRLGGLLPDLGLLHERLVANKL
jgi:hypothetical protein